MPPSQESWLTKVPAISSRITRDSSLQMMRIILNSHRGKLRYQSAVANGHMQSRLRTRRCQRRVRRRRAICSWIDLCRLIITSYIRVLRYRSSNWRCNRQQPPQRLITRGQLRRRIGRKGVWVRQLSLSLHPLSPNQGRMILPDSAQPNSTRARIDSSQGSHRTRHVSANRLTWKAGAFPVW